MNIHENGFTFPIKSNGTHKLDRPSQSHIFLNLQMLFARKQILTQLIYN